MRLDKTDRFGESSISIEFCFFYLDCINIDNKEDQIHSQSLSI